MYMYAVLGNAYSVPPAVRDRHTVLAGTIEFSPPDEFEVFIFTHPAKCKITQTIIFVTIKSESEAMHLI